MTKYFIAYNQFLKVMRELTRLDDSVKALIGLVGVNYVPRDNILMSPTQNKLSLALSISWEGDQSEIKAAVRGFERLIRDHLSGVDFTSRLSFDNDDLLHIYGERLQLFERMVHVQDTAGKLQSSVYHRLIKSIEFQEDL